MKTGTGIVVMHFRALGDAEPTPVDVAVPACENDQGEIFAKLPPDGRLAQIHPSLFRWIEGPLIS